MPRCYPRSQTRSKHKTPDGSSSRVADGEVSDAQEIPLRSVQGLSVKDLTVYKIIYTAVDERPGVRDNSLKELVGARGFEPPTPWSRTRCQRLLKPMESCRF